MKKDELIQKIKETTSVVDFYKLKEEIIKELGDKPRKKGED